MYTIVDLQNLYPLEGNEKSLRDCLERLISFHSIDTYIFDIKELVEYDWGIFIGNSKYKDITSKFINKFKQGKGKRLFKKIRNRYMNKKSILF